MTVLELSQNTVEENSFDGMGQGRPGGKDSSAKCDLCFPVHPCFLAPCFCDVMTWIYPLMKAVPSTFLKLHQPAARPQHTAESPWCIVAAVFNLFSSVIISTFVLSLMLSGSDVARDRQWSVVTCVCCFSL